MPHAAINQPSMFALTDFFAGPVRATGFFEDRFGRVRRRFSVVMNGRWEGSAFLLEEDFVYDDGEIQHRIWKVVPGRDGAFVASAHDVVGVVRGKSDADGVSMTYRMRMPVDGRELTFGFADRIYRMDDDTSFSRATVSKWGITMGWVSITYRRASSEGANDNNTLAAA